MANTIIKLMRNGKSRLIFAVSLDILLCITLIDPVLIWCKGKKNILSIQVFCYLFFIYLVKAPLAI
jgi:hypothetical protein